MIEAGLPIDVETGFRTLQEIVKEVGPDSSKHYDMLLERLGLRWSPEVIAAGVVAYRQMSRGYLRPYSDTVPTLLKLRDLQVKLGCASAGKSVKRWEQLIGLGLEHVFHSVLISEDIGQSQFTSPLVGKVVESLQVKKAESILVGSHPDTEIKVANQAGVTSVLLKQGSGKLEKSPQNRANYVIERLSDVLKLVTK